MKVYVFRSVSQPDVSAFAADELGSSLPSIYAPWQPIRAMCLASERDPIVCTVRISGHCLVGTTSELELQGEYPAYDINPSPRDWRDFRRTSRLIR